MLSDLLTSSRGPGVIGTVMALIVLLGFGSLFILATDESGVFGGENIYTQIKSKGKAIQSKQREVEHWKKAAVDYDQRKKQLGEIENKQSTIQLKLAEIERVKVTVEEDQGKLTKLEQQVVDYKKQYQLSERARAVGEKFDTMLTKDGVSYEQVSIRKISALGMEIRHKNGFKRISYQNLPDVLQDRFQFTEDGAKALASVEQDAVKRSDQGKQNYHQSVKERRKQQLLRDHRENMVKWTSEIARYRARIRLNESKIDAAQQRASSYRARGNRGLNYDSAKKEDRKADQLRKSSSRLSAMISSLRRKLNQPPPQ
jgi:hypothetical protein